MLLLSANSHRPNSFNNGTFPCVSVVVSIIFDNYQTFANFVEILYADMYI